MRNERSAKAEAGAWVGIIGNLLIAVMKGIVGWYSGSKALLADAFHSASDIAGSLAVLVGIRAARIPPDKDHPYGHGKAESIAAIVVSLLLVFVGFEIARSSILAIFSGVHEAPKGYAVLAIIISIIVKEAMFQYKYRLGRQLGSQALIANAWEHRSDVYSSLAALVGVGGALVGEWQHLPWLLYLDPLAGLVVAVLVLRMGYRLVVEAIHNTMDHVLHDEDSKELVDAVLSVSGVIEVDELRAREHGHYVIVDVKLSVNPRISVLEGHRIGKRVKQHLMSHFDHVSDVFIHVNPYDPGFPYKSNHHMLDDDHPTMLQ